MGDITLETPAERATRRADRALLLDSAYFSLEVPLDRNKFGQELRDLARGDFSTQETGAITFKDFDRVVRTQARAFVNTFGLTFRDIFFTEDRHSSVPADAYSTGVEHVKARLFYHEQRCIDVICANYREELPTNGQSLVLARSIIIALETGLVRARDLIEEIQFRSKMSEFFAEFATRTDIDPALCERTKVISQNLKKDCDLILVSLDDHKTFRDCQRHQREITLPGEGKLSPRERRYVHLLAADVREHGGRIFEETKARFDSRTLRDLSHSQFERAVYVKDADIGAHSKAKKYTHTEELDLLDLYFNPDFRCPPESRHAHQADYDSIASTFEKLRQSRDPASLPYTRGAVVLKIRDLISSHWYKKQIERIGTLREEKTKRDESSKLRSRAEWRKYLESILPGVNPDSKQILSPKERALVGQQGAGRRPYLLTETRELVALVEEQDTETNKRVYTWKEVARLLRSRSRSGILRSPDSLGHKYLELMRAEADLVTRSLSNKALLNDDATPDWHKIAITIERTLGFERSASQLEDKYGANSTLITG